jgi:prepilin-type N-terminal cleavage/methylation domain-containing protein
MKTARAKRPHGGVGKTSDRGFTAVELVVGMVVVAILGTGAAVGISSVIANGHDATAKQQLQAIAAAETHADVDEGRYVPVSDLVTAHGLGADAGTAAVVLTDSYGSCFVSSKLSKTGKVFIATSTDTVPRELTSLVAKHGSTAKAGCANFTYTDASVTDPAASTPVLNATPLPVGYVGASFQAALNAGGPGTKFGVSGGTIPPGLMLKSSTGVIAGAPTEAGTYTFGVTLTNETATTAPVNHTIVIKNEVAAPTFYDSAMVATLDTFRPASVDISIPGAVDTTYSVDPAAPLPAGLTLNPTTGVIKGYPKTAALGSWDAITATGTVRATNAAGSSSLGVFLNLVDSTVEFKVNVPAGQSIAVSLGEANLDATILWDAAAADWDNPAKVTETSDPSIPTAAGIKTPTHTYPTAGVYTIRISGKVGSIAPSTAANNWTRFVTSIERWGETGMAATPTFNLATSLTKVAEIPKDMTSLSAMFASSNFNGDISGIDTSRVTDMSRMFNSATKFNQPLGANFDTSKATNMERMFYAALAFNQPLGAKFNTANVTNFSNVFGMTDSFNQPLGANFDTSKATNMFGMFNEALVFNQPLGAKFTTKNATSVRFMFKGAAKFNQPVYLDLSKVTNAEDTQAMFWGAFAFKQDLTGWTMGIQKNTASPTSVWGSTRYDWFAVHSGMTWEQLPRWVG